jgi:hypothetical protein
MGGSAGSPLPARLGPSAETLIVRITGNLQHREVAESYQLDLFRIAVPLLNALNPLVGLTPSD